MSNSYIDFETKTSVFREFTRLLVEGDERMNSMMNRLVREKREKITTKVAASDAESIFKAIESGNPLAKG